VGRWLHKGKLPYFHTAGGHRRVWDTDLIAFLQRHNIPVPHELSGAVLTRVLIVDDEAPTRRLVRRIVQSRFPQAEIHEAADGFGAGQKTARFLPTLVILDLRLPGLDGFRVCRDIRENPELRHIRILAMSGHSVQESRGKAMEAGADDFLAKPFEPDAMAEKVRQCLERESAKPHGY